MGGSSLLLDHASRNLHVRELGGRTKGDIAFHSGATRLAVQHVLDKLIVKNMAVVAHG